MAIIDSAMIEADEISNVRPMQDTLNDELIRIGVVFIKDVWTYARTPGYDLPPDWVIQEAVRLIVERVQEG